MVKYSLDNSESRVIYCSATVDEPVTVPYGNRLQPLSVFWSASRCASHRFSLCVRAWCPTVRLAHFFVHTKNERFASLAILNLCFGKNVLCAKCVDGENACLCAFIHLVAISRKISIATAIVWFLQNRKSPYVRAIFCEYRRALMNCAQVGNWIWIGQYN